MHNDSTICVTWLSFLCSIWTHCVTAWFNHPFQPTTYPIPGHQVGVGGLGAHTTQRKKELFPLLSTLKGNLAPPISLPSMPLDCGKESLEKTNARKLKSQYRKGPANPHQWFSSTIQTYWITVWSPHPPPPDWKQIMKTEPPVISKLTLSAITFTHATRKALLYWLKWLKPIQSTNLPISGPRSFVSINVFTQT